MFIFQQDNGSYAIALDNTHAKVVMYNRITNDLVTEVPNLVDILHHRYHHSTHPETHSIPKDAEQLGGRTWKSLKYAIAHKLGMPKAEMHKIVKGYLL